MERPRDTTELDEPEGATFHDGGDVGHSGYQHDIRHKHVYSTAFESFCALWRTLRTRPGEPWEDNPQVVRVGKFRRAA